MANKTNKKFEVYVLKVIKEFVPILLLQRHTFKLKKGTEDNRVYMECVFNYPYLNVTIKYSKRIVKKWRKNEDIVPYIVHEMCHPITDPLYTKATARYVSKDEILDERERLTDYICNIALKMKG